MDDTVAEGFDWQLNTVCQGFIIILYLVQASLVGYDLMMSEQ